MPRHRTVSDEDLLSAAFHIVQLSGPAALSFGSLASEIGLAASTIVQRFGSKAALLRAALALAWDRLDDATASATSAAAVDSSGVVDLLVALSGQYDAHDFADQLLVLREDLRDPVLRARGEAWIGDLVRAIEVRLASVPGGADGLGQLIVAHWQGTLTVWSFTRSGPLQERVRVSTTELLTRLGARPV